MKRATLVSSLPGLPIDGEVESINHLFHFVVPITAGSAITMISQINDIKGTAFSEFSGDLATVQWSLKATAWAYATTNMPSIEVNMTERVFADYNQDGIVNAADYTVWRDSLGSNSDLDADGDGDGIVDDDDYLIWKLTFGSIVEPGSGYGSLDTSAFVPEPPTFSLTVFAMAAIICCSRKPRSARISGRSNQDTLW